MKNTKIYFLLLIFLSSLSYSQELLFCCGDWDFESGFDSIVGI